MNCQTSSQLREELTHSQSAKQKKPASAGFSQTIFIRFDHRGTDEPRVELQQKITNVRLIDPIVSG